MSQFLSREVKSERIHFAEISGHSIATRRIPNQAWRCWGWSKVALTYLGSWNDSAPFFDPDKIKFSRKNLACISWKLTNFHLGVTIIYSLIFFFKGSLKDKSCMNWAWNWAKLLWVFTRCKINHLPITNKLHILTL